MTPFSHNQSLCCVDFAFVSYFAVKQSFSHVYNQPLGMSHARSASNWIRRLLVGPRRPWIIGALSRRSG